jgi:transforming growth factor-beta-induced protein
MNKYHLSITAALAVTLCGAPLTAATPKSEPVPPIFSETEDSQDIVETAIAAGFSTLASALTQAGLVDVLKGDGPFTVFAPTDAAFAALPAGTLESLTPEQLVDILTYHVIDGEVLAADVAAGPVTMLNGDSALITIEGDSISIDGAPISDTDVIASNGVIHIIDAVMLPPTDIVDTAISSGFSTLASALTSAGLVEALQGEGPFTVFAPTDAAFAALPAGTLESLTPEQLVDILTYHVVDGQVLAADVAAGPVTMLNGDSALITIDGDMIAIDGANIAATDIITTNGVIHVIESVMLPPTDIVDTAISSGFSTLASALTSAGLVEALQGEGPFTVFAPTDAAFAALPAGTLESLTPEQLVDILTYHVVDGQVLAADVAAGPVTMLNGDSALITIDGDMIAIDGANIAATDIITTNGVIHVIESVMLPPTDIVDTAISSGFSTLASALTSAGLVEALQGEGPFTVFAPTDAAFAALPAGTLESLTPEQLVDILTYHVIAGEVLAADVAAGPVTMLNGDSALITIDGDMIAIDGANIAATDIITTNGVIHVIESVMLPPTDIVDTAISSGFSTLASALTSAGLVETLQGEGPFTVFAPTDAAFAALPEGTLESLTPEQLVDILTFHVVPAEVLAGDVMPGPVTTVNGNKVLLSADEQGNLFIDGVAIIATDVVTSNGVIHVIEGVLLPPVDIVDTAVAAGFSTLAGALDAAGLVDALRGEGPFTVFAPTNEAFAAVPAEILGNLTLGQLTKILTYHVFAGEVFSGDVAPGAIEMLNGTEATLSADNEGNLFIDAAQIVATDVISSNGVIHVIDNVIVPFNITLPWAGVDPDENAFSPWFGAFTGSVDDWVNHSEFGWLYVGGIESTDSMWFYSSILGAWIWSNQDNFPIFYNSSTSSYIYFIFLEEIGLWVYDYATGTWTRF